MPTIVQSLYRLVQITGHDRAGGSGIVPIDGANVQARDFVVEVGSHNTNRDLAVDGAAFSLSYRLVERHDGNPTIAMAELDVASSLAHANEASDLRK